MPLQDPATRDVIKGKFSNIQIIADASYLGIVNKTAYLLLISLASFMLSYLIKPKGCKNIID